MTERVFLDSSVLVRYLAEDDPPRALAAAKLIDGDAAVVISAVVLLETLHTLRTGLGHENPELARVLIRFVTRENVEVVDADKVHLVAALERTLATSARRVTDAIVAATAEHAGCDWIATFDEGFRSPSVPSRLIERVTNRPSPGLRRRGRGPGSPSRRRRPGRRRRGAGR